MDLIALGLNIDGFSDDKKAKLESFLQLFERLHQYDGAKFNPVSGEGLTSFNAAIKNTNDLLDQLNQKIVALGANQTQSSQTAASAANQYTQAVNQNTNAQRNNSQSSGANHNQNSELISDYKKLTQLLKEQATAYSNLYLAGKKNTPEAKQALRDYKDTAKVIDDIDIKLGKAQTGLLGLGKGASTFYNQIRQLAYILPGIGIAGIFNLAFEAIGKAGDMLFNFNNDLIDNINHQEQVNKILSEQVKLYEYIVSAQKVINERRREDFETQSKFGFDKARGYSGDVTKKDAVEESLLRFNKAEAALLPKYSNAEQAQKANQLLLGQIDQLSARLLKKESELAERDSPEWKAKRSIQLKSRRGVVPISSVETLEAQKKEMESRLENLKKNYEATDKILKEYGESEKQYNEKKAEYEKYLEDEARKKRTEIAKSDISLEIDKNEKILRANISTEKERLEAIKKIKDEELKLNKVNFDNVLTNLSSSEADKAIALNKYLDDNEKAKTKYEENYNKITEEYRQRYIKSSTDILKDRVEKEALAAERIWKNETNSLEERLKAYNVFLQKKQTLQDLEYARDREKQGQTPEELEALESNRKNQRLNTQADAEHQVYSIVKESLEKELKTVLDSNRLQEREFNKLYADELNALNKQLENKHIKYSQYQKLRRQLDDRFQVESLNKIILDDQQELKRLQDFLDKETKLLEEARKKQEKARQKLEDKQSSGGDTEQEQKDYDEATGEVKAIEDTSVDADKERQKAQEKLDDDELKRAKRKYDKLHQYDKEYSEGWKAIRDALYNFAIQMNDKEFEESINKLRAQTEARLAGYDDEITAIQKSSLSEKEKFALELQLNAQKEQIKRNQEAEEKRLKIEQAKIDRDLTIAHILWNTEESVSAALTLPPPAGEIIAAQRAILGGIEIATVMATAIPSYAEGTGNEPHKGGLARFGEAGWEIVKEPYKSPYLVMTETISYLPKGTEVIPVKDNPDFPEMRKDNSWEQTRWLAKQFQKANKDINNNISVINKIDLGFENYKSKVLGR
jgi:hypothetical protein